MGQSTSTRRRRYHHASTTQTFPTSFHPYSFRPPRNLGFSNLPPSPPPPPPSYLVSFPSTPYYAYHPSPRSPPQKATSVKNYVNLHKNSIQLEPDKLNPGHHLVSFKFDSLVDGSFTILYFAKEQLNGSFSLCYPDLCTDVCIPFQKGEDQKFDQPSGTGIDLGFFELDELSKPLDGCFFPLVVYAEPFPLHLPKDELTCQSTAAAHSQITEAVIEKNNNGPFQVKVIKQILWVDGECYELQEIFDVGISAAGFDGDDSEKKCVICMSESRDTAVLPCRHMCMCSECAKALRLQSNRCPICRQTIETTMEIPNKREEGKNAESSEA